MEDNVKQLMRLLPEGYENASRETASVMEDVIEWHGRPLDKR